MDQARIRLARPEKDAAALLDIYAPYVRDTPVSFECEVPPLEDFTRRIQGIAQDYPYLVCEINHTIAAYAYAHRHKERAAYAWNAELSVYVSPAFIRRGLGSALYNALMALLKLQGVLNVYGIVTLPNPASERLHERLGFRRVGVYRKTGYKLGAWHDVACFEKNIRPYGPRPQPLLPLAQVPPHIVTGILEAHSAGIGGV